jgi:hypothetical protein
MAAPVARRFASRLRNLGTFVVIVWGVATTFVAFENVALGGVELALAYPALFGNIALSGTVTESTSCDVSSGEATEGGSPAVSAGDARVGAWLLGLSFGREALLRQHVKGDVQVLDELATARNALAARLGAPGPSMFRAQRVATANPEFVAFVEDDRGGTAHRLAVTYSPRACELFKLGALWGYSEMIRPSLPGERAVHVLEIRYHARRAEVPEPLWSPMLQRVPADATADGIITATQALTSGVTTFLADPAATAPRAPQ